MHRINFLLFFVILFLTKPVSVFGNKKITAKSPDNKIELTISLQKDISYSIWHDGQKILDDSKIALVLSGNKVLGHEPKLISNKEKVFHENITSPFYRASSFSVDYRELDLKFKGEFGILFRIYNEGVAYRFYTTQSKDIEIQDEIAEFNFDKDYKTYLSHTTSKEDPFAMAFQNVYEVKNISEADTSIVFLPATIDVGNSKKLTLLESDLEAYPGMFIQTTKGKHSFRGIFAPYPNSFDIYEWRYQQYVTGRSPFIAKTKGRRTFPWRILAISGKDADMPVNNMVYALASPNRIGDYSWVKLGKSAWEWWNDWGIYNVDFKAGINMETYKHYIDFASKYGLEYIILDEGWYDSNKGNMMKSIPEINLTELVAYAKEKNVGIILWTVFNVIDAQLEEACKYYSELGIKGFKIDFLDRDDQLAVEMTYRIAEAAARYKLVLDLHGYHKPTGINRTYPNIINFEGVFGMEEARWSTMEKDMPRYDVTFPFIRMMAGPVDFTPGAMLNGSQRVFQPIYYNSMSQGTRCHQLATYVVYDSPFTMLCDSPTLYEKEEEYTHFLSSIPVEVDETKVLSGELGEYIVTARRKGNDWYVGGLTNWSARDLQVNFSFLENGKKYKAVIYKDGVNADKHAADYVRESVIVDSNTQLSLNLASGGGFVISLHEEQAK
jgi:alpha-glucosidase